MSGYHRDDRSHSGRDDRERSPSRNPRGNLRKRSPPRQGNERRRDYPHTSQQAAIEKFPGLPDEVLIPKGTGASLGLKKWPDQGTIGRPINVMTNHFTIQSLPVVKTYQYDVRFYVPPSSQKRGIEKVSSMQKAKAVLRAQKLFGQDFVFDSISLGWSTTLLFPVLETRSTIIDLENHSTEKPNQIKIDMRNTGTLKIAKLVNYLKSGKSGTTAKEDQDIEDCFKWLNALFKKDPSERFLSRPKSTAFFHRSPEVICKLQSTGGVLEAIRGIHQAVAVCFGQISINVDVLTCAFYVPGICMTEVAKAFSGMPSGQNLQDIHTNSTFIEACTRMINMFVVVHHLNETKNAHKMRIQRLSQHGARGTIFEELDRLTGRSTTTNVFDYFRRKYSIKLRYPDLPLLITKEGSFPMELLFTAAGERYKEPLQGVETKDFIKFATSPAYVRAQQVMANVKELKWHTLSTPKKMGLSVATRMTELNARILPCPTPLYRSGTDRLPPNSGSWNLRGKQLLSAARVSSWGLLYFPGSRSIMDDRALEEFKIALAKSLAALGFSLPGTLPPHLNGNPRGNMKEIISNIYGKTGSLFNRKPHILFFLLHDGANPLIYKAIKSFCEVDQGTASQIMIVEKATSLKGQQQYLANVGLKVNLKLGGANTSVKMPFISEGVSIMMLGADSSHPSPTELRRIPPPPSFSAVVASYDPACVKYTAVASVQPATNEFISNMKAMAIELLRRFFVMNKMYPKRIVFWRDGIGESQIKAFKDSEVKALREVCQELQLEAMISVINCVKNHHTRFFPRSGEQGDKLGNVLPGTCVEASHEPDFFLVSQSALQGCCRPTRYQIIIDDNNLSADQFQGLANGLCFAYGRATRSVKVVCPVYYADQVCERARMHIRAAADESVGQSFLMDVHKDLTYTMYWQ